MTKKQLFSVRTTDGPTHRPTFDHRPIDPNFQTALLLWYPLAMVEIAGLKNDFEILAQTLNRGVIP